MKSGALRVRCLYWSSASQHCLRHPKHTPVSSVARSYTRATNESQLRDRGVDPDCMTRSDYCLTRSDPPCLPPKALAAPTHVGNKLIPCAPSNFHRATAFTKDQQRANVRGAYCGGRRGRGGGNTGRGRGGVQRGGFVSSVRGGRVASSGALYDAPLIYKGNQPARVDARVHSADKFIPRLRGLGLVKEHPPRPGYGKLGHAIVVRANFFAMELTRDTFYEYAINISPLSHSRKPTAHVKRRVIALFERSPVALPYVHKIAHDGAQRLIAAERLPEPLQDVVKYSDDDDHVPAHAESYTVSVQFSKELPTAPLKKYVRCINYRLSLLLIV